MRKRKEGTEKRLCPRFNRALKKRVKVLMSAIEVGDADIIEQVLAEHPEIIIGWGSDFPLIEASKRFMPQVLILAFKHYHPADERRRFEFAELARRAEEAASFAWVDHFTAKKSMDKTVYERYGETLKFCRKIAALSPPARYKE